MPYTQTYLDNHTPLNKSVRNALDSLFTCTQAALTQQATTDKDAQRTLDLLPALWREVDDNIAAIENDTRHTMQDIARSFKLITEKKQYQNNPQLRAFIEMSKVLCMQLVRTNTLLALTKDQNNTPQAQKTIIEHINNAHKPQVIPENFAATIPSFDKKIGAITSILETKSKQAQRNNDRLQKLSLDISRAHAQFKTRIEPHHGTHDHVRETFNTYLANIDSLTQTLSINTNTLTLENLKEHRNKLSDQQQLLAQDAKQFQPFNQARQQFNTVIHSCTTPASLEFDTFNRQINTYENSLPKLTSEENKTLDAVENQARIIKDALAREQSELDRVINTFETLNNDPRLNVPANHFAIYESTITDLQKTLDEELTELPGQSSAVSRLKLAHIEQASAFTPLSTIIAYFKTTLAICNKETEYGYDAWQRNLYGTINSDITKAQHRLQETLHKHKTRKAALEREANAISVKYDRCNSAANQLNKQAALNEAKVALSAYETSINEFNQRQLTDDQYKALVASSEKTRNAATNEIENIDATIKALNALNEEMQLLEIDINTPLNANPPPVASKHQALIQLRTELDAIMANNTPANFKSNQNKVKKLSDRLEKQTGNKRIFANHILDKIISLDLKSSKPLTLAQILTRGMLIGAVVGLVGFLATVLLVTFLMPGVNVFTTSIAIGIGVCLFSVGSGVGIAGLIKLALKKRDELRGKKGIEEVEMTTGQLKIIERPPVTPKHNSHHDGFITTYDQEKWKTPNTQDSFRESTHRGSTASLRLSMTASASQRSSQSFQGNSRHSAVIPEPVSLLRSEGQGENKFKVEADLNHRSDDDSQVVDSWDLSSSGSMNLS